MEKIPYQDLNNQKNNQSGDSEKSVKNKSKLKQFLFAITLAFFIAVIFKSFLVDAYKIPTGSMKNTLLVGDFILVNKAAYSLSTPLYFPLTTIKIPSVKLLSYHQPERNDVIVFEYPGNPDELYPNLPENFIKRIVGLPGDTVQIVNKKVFINKKLIKTPSNALMDNVVRPKGEKEKRIYPEDKNWNEDNYGPIVVPKKGDKININPKNILEWEALIDRENKSKAVSVEGTVITINGQPVRSYTFKENYYFVMGDNRDDSMDSRFWGFVPNENIIGKAILIYWSWDPFIPYSNFSKLVKSIRFNRILKIIH